MILEEEEYYFIWDSNYSAEKGEICKTYSLFLEDP